MKTDQVCTIPAAGYLRIHQILGNPKANPPMPPLIPISRSSWWQGIKDGRYPKSIKLGPKTTCWKAEDIRSFIESGSMPAIK